MSAPLRHHRISRLSYDSVHRSHKSHMAVKWHELIEDADTPAYHASLADKSTLVCRAGLIMLSGGTGGYRVREVMNAVAEALGITCVVDVGLITLECTCIDGHETYSEVLSLATTGVNTQRIMLMEQFVDAVILEGPSWSVCEFHRRLDEIEHTPGNYAPWQVGLAAAFACGAFVFLLGGGPVEMLCAFCGAGVGNYLRRKMIDKHLTQFACIGASVAVACLVYLGVLTALSAVVPNAWEHEAGYIGAMLFVIPGFPLITSGFDIAKLDLRSGIERLVYALTVIVVATLVAWLVVSAVALVTQRRRWRLPRALSARSPTRCAWSSSTSQACPPPRQRLRARFLPGFWPRSCACATNFRASRSRCPLSSSWCRDFTSTAPCTTWVRSTPSRRFRGARAPL